jgi:hypothetical protein
MFIYISRLSYVLIQRHISSLVVPKVMELLMTVCMCICVCVNVCASVNFPTK